MDEMYENFEDGDDWQLEDEKDPFTESPDVESLGYVVSMPLLFADDLCYFPLFLIILVPFSLLLSRSLQPCFLFSPFHLFSLQLD